MQTADEQGCREVQQQSPAWQTSKLAEVRPFLLTAKLAASHRAKHQSPQLKPVCLVLFG